MIKNIKFTELEIKHLIIGIIVATIVFAFDDKQPTFIFGHWLYNFLKVLIIVTISYLAHIIAQKNLAKRYGAITEHKLWTTQRYWFRAETKFPFKIYIGLILPLFLTFVSLGKIILPLTTVFDMKGIKEYRLGRKWGHLAQYDIARIAAAGPLVNLVIAFLFKILSLILPFTFQNMININLILALVNMIPLPQLDGAHIFFNSKPYYVLTIIFISGCALLINQVNVLLTLIIAALAAILFTLLYLYKIEFKVS